MMSHNSFKTVIYTGPSMNPMFRTGDMLYVIPYGSRKISAGDVVIFSSTRSGRDIAHRVISVTLNGIKTQGDNNPCADCFVLHPSRIRGQVVYLRRSKTRMRIYGGLAGQWCIILILVYKFPVRIAMILLRPIYRLFIRLGIFKKWRIWKLQINVLAYQRPVGMEYQARIGSVIVGRRLPDRKGWRIRPPFGLFIDEKDLNSAVYDLSGLAIVSHGTSQES